MGAGAVGTTVAYASLMTGVARTVVLYDRNRAKAEAEALDLAHGIQFMPMADVQGSDDLAVVQDADVVVFAAGAKQRPGQTRMDLAASTTSLVADLLPRVVEVAPAAVYLLLTNPVDVVTYVAVQATGLPPERVFGSVTVLASSRLRYLLARETGLAVRNVHAAVVGEHGDSELPLWSAARVAEVPLASWTGRGGPFDEDRLTAIAHQVVRAADVIIAGKGATNYAIGVAAARIIRAVLKDENAVLTVSALLEGYLGLDDVCLSVPTVVGVGGVGDRIAVPVNERELDGLRKSADAVRSVARALGY